MAVFQSHVLPSSDRYRDAKGRDRVWDVEKIVGVRGRGSAKRGKVRGERGGAISSLTVTVRSTQVTVNSQFQYSQRFGR